MAYSIPISLNCQKEGCKRMALEEVFNGQNGRLGRFCPFCAKALVTELNELERKRANPESGRDSG